MKKLKIPMMMLFLMGFLIIGACEKFEDPDPVIYSTQEALEDSALEQDQSRETLEDEKKIKRQSDPAL